MLHVWKERSMVLLVSSDTSESRSRGLSQTISHSNTSRGRRTVSEVAAVTAGISRWNMSCNPGEAARDPPLFFLPTVHQASCFLLVPPLLWMETTSSPTGENRRVSSVSASRLTNSLSVRQQSTAFNQSGSAPNSQLCNNWLVEQGPP